MTKEEYTQLRGEVIALKKKSKSIKRDKRINEIFIQMFDDPEGKTFLFAELMTHMMAMLVVVLFKNIQFKTTIDDHKKHDRPVGA